MEAGLLWLGKGQEGPAGTVVGRGVSRLHKASCSFCDPGPPPQLSWSSSLSLRLAVPLPPTQTLALLCYSLSLSKACSSPSADVLALTFRPTVSEGHSGPCFGAVQAPHGPFLVAGGLLTLTAPTLPVWPQGASLGPPPRVRGPAPRLPALEFWPPAGLRVLLRASHPTRTPAVPPTTRASGLWRPPPCKLRDPHAQSPPPGLPPPPLRACFSRPRPASENRFAASQEYLSSGTSSAPSSVHLRLPAPAPRPPLRGCASSGPLPRPWSAVSFQPLWGPQ